MLLLFWSGIQSANGVASATGAASGVGLRQALGTGAAAGVAALSGTGLEIHQASGTISAFGVGLGDGVLIGLPISYEFEVEQDAANYRSEQESDTIQYWHQGSTR